MCACIVGWQWQRHTTHHTDIGLLYSCVAGVSDSKEVNRLPIPTMAVQEYCLL